MTCICAVGLSIGMLCHGCSMTLSLTDPTPQQNPDAPPPPVRTLHFPPFCSSFVLPAAAAAAAASVMAALATCHRQAGDLDTAARLFRQLYEINERQSEGGAANQSGVMLARTLADIYQEAEKNRCVWWGGAVWGCVCFFRGGGGVSVIRRLRRWWCCACVDKQGKGNVCVSVSLCVCVCVCVISEGGRGHLRFGVRGGGGISGCQGQVCDCACACDCVCLCLCLSVSVQ